MADEKITIQVNLPVERGSLISEIKALPKLTRPVKKEKQVLIEDEPLILSSLGKGKKKDKKKKGKKKKEELNFLVADENDTVDLDGVDVSISGSNLIDIDAILNRDDDDYETIGDPIIDEQRRGYEKRKKDENPFKKEFAEELTLLYDLLDEMNRLSKELDKKYKTFENSKVRGSSKYANDHVINMLNAKSSKLQIIKEINNLKKVIADLKIKQDGKTKGAEAGQMGTEMMASQYFQQVLKYGRNNFVKQFGDSSPQVDEDIDDIVNQIERDKMDYNDDEIDRFQSLIDERLENDDNLFRSSEGSKYIQYENLGVKIYIKRCVDTGEWEFIALDRDQQQIHDYPLPSKRDVGKVRFQDRYATDERGRTYNVIEYYLPVE